MRLSKPHRFLLPLAAFFAVLPLLIHGPTCGHDFDFHLLSWFEAATQYAHGGYPHWAFTPAYNAGEPRFLFYPPISWTLGALLTLVFPIQYVATAYTFVALTLSGFTAHRLARRYATSNGALLCATLYLANPYMLFTAYERSAFAELLAAAWLPLLFEAALTLAPYPSRPTTETGTIDVCTPNQPGCPMITEAQPRLSWAGSPPRLTSQILRIALPIALLWLTNAPAAVMGCYALLILTLIRLLLHAVRLLICHSRRESAVAFLNLSTAPSASSLTCEAWSPTPQFFPSQVILTTLAGTLLGLLLPAFYLLPAAYERRYVQIALATINGMRPQDHFLFHRMPTQTPEDLFHNAVVHTASIVSLLLLAAIAAALFLSIDPLSSRPERSEAEEPALQPVTAILVPLTALLTFLLFPPSLPLWKHIPQLLYLQFPWRLDALLAVILLVLAARSLHFCCHFVAQRRNLRLQSWWGAILSPLLAIALIRPAYTFFHQPCEAADAPQARAALFHSPLGTEPTDEYTPATADNDALHRSAPWWFACLATHPAPGLPSPSTDFSGQAPITLEADLPCPALVVLNRRAYPIWAVTANGRPVPPAGPARDDGLISFDAPAGHLSVHVRYHRTPDQLLGLLLSFLAAIIAFLLWKRPALDEPTPPTGPLPFGPLDGGPELNRIL